MPPVATNMAKFEGFEWPVRDRGVDEVPVEAGYPLEGPIVPA